MQGLRLEQKLKQELALQPQQILRSELIQLPLLELEMRVNSELEENPFLDELEETDEVEATNGVEKVELAEEDDKTDPEPVEETGPREVDWDEILNDSSHWEYRARTRSQSEDMPDIPQPAETTLVDHLHEQLHLDDLSATEVLIGEEIFGNINRDGYLEVDLDEIARSSNQPIEKIAAVHEKIMQYDPVGIAARNLQECLLVQLKLQHPEVLVSIRMLEEFYQDFINKRFEVLSGKMEISLDEVKEAFDMIARLNPKPGEGYFNEKQNYIIPDLIVTKLGGEYVVYLNDGDIPNFHINPTYREMYLSSKGTEKKVRDFLSRKFESARWFINAIHQRRTTMLRTTRAIVERQKEFFDRGAAYLKPMILADIAEDIGMDISTISRVTNGKYVQTDWGVFELKYFFSERMETDEGGEVSNRVIKARLKDLIDLEDKHKPLSDQELTDMLNEEGFQIRRRTVAKYREQMRIPIKRLRREL